MKHQITYFGGSILLCAVGACGGAGDTAGVGHGGNGGNEATTAEASSSVSGTGGGGPNLICSATGLERELLRAQSGDTVWIGACTVDGSFSVPAGVTLAGQGMGKSIIHGPAGKPAVRLVPGGGVATTLHDLSILSDGTAGILAKGPGVLQIKAVAVTANVGIGVGVEGATTLLIEGVKLTGPVTLQTASSVLYPPDPAKTATHGIVLVDVKGGSNKLSDVTATGFADYGALFVRSGVAWAIGGAPNNLGTGLFIVGGDVSLDTLDLSGNYQATRPLPSYGAVITDHVTGVMMQNTLATVTSKGLTVKDNTGIGVLQDGALVDTVHTDLVGENNGMAAIWAQGGTQAFVLNKPLIDKSLFAGLVAVDMKAITIKGGYFRSAKKKTFPVGAGKKDVTLGDGLHLVRPTNINVNVTDVDLMGNERVGLLVDVEAAMPSGFKWMNHTVEAPPNAFGALCQGVQNNQPMFWPNETPNGWDVGIVRDQSTLAVDKTPPPSPIDVVGAVGPDIIPAPITVIKGGLAGVIGP